MVAAVVVADVHFWDCPRDCPGHEQAVLPAGDGLAARALETMARRLSGHTRRAYARGWARWTDWAAGAGLEAAPGDPAAVCLYLQTLKDGGAAASSIAGARAAIVAGHDAAGVGGADNPGRHPAVAAFMAGIWRDAAARPQRQAAALLGAHLEAISRTAAIPRPGKGGGVESGATAAARGAVDLAMAYLLHDAGLRLAELAAVRWGDVTPEADGSGRLRVVRAKQRGGAALADVVALGPGCMSALGRLGRGGDDEAVIPLSRAQVARRLKAALTAAGYAGAAFSGHSGRVGLARDMSRRGAPDSVIARQAGWRDLRMVSRYTRNESAAAALPYLRAESAESGEIPPDVAGGGGETA